MFAKLRGGVNLDPRIWFSERKFMILTATSSAEVTLFILSTPIFWDLEITAEDEKMGRRYKYFSSSLLNSFRIISISHTIRYLYGLFSFVSKYTAVEQHFISNSSTLQKHTSLHRISQISLQILRLLHLNKHTNSRSIPVVTMYQPLLLATLLTLLVPSTNALALPTASPAPSFWDLFRSKPVPQHWDISFMLTQNCAKGDAAPVTFSGDTADDNACINVYPANTPPTSNRTPPSFRSPSPPPLPYPKLTHPVLLSALGKGKLGTSGGFLITAFSRDNCQGPDSITSTQNMQPKTLQVDGGCVSLDAPREIAGEQLGWRSFTVVNIRK